MAELPASFWKKHGDILFLAALGVAMFVFVLLPIELPYEMQAKGKVFPIKSWVLTRGTDGQITSSFFDYQQGTSKQFAVTQFEERDALRFALSDSLALRRTVRAGEVVGTIYSSFASRQLGRIQASLAAERALLQQYVTGEQSAVVDEARHVLGRAKSQLADQERTVARLTELAGRGVISKVELEQAQSILETYQENVGIAEAQMRRVQSGVKPEQANLVRTRIKNYEAERQALLAEATNQTFATPIGGKVIKTPSSDTLLVVTDTSAFIVYIPIPLKHYEHVAVGQQVKMETLVKGQHTTGIVVERDPIVYTVQGKQVMMVAARVEGDAVLDFFPGYQTVCIIKGEPVSPREYMRRFLGTLYRA